MQQKLIKIPIKFKFHQTPGPERQEICKKYGRDRLWINLLISNPLYYACIIALGLDSTTTLTYALEQSEKILHITHMTRSR